MKSAVHWFCVFVGVIGTALLVVNVGHAAMNPPSHELDELVRLARYTAGAAQIAPMAGFWFGREVLVGADRKAWNTQRRAGFIVWVVVAIPIALLGALSALTIGL